MYDTELREAEDSTRITLADGSVVYVTGDGIVTTYVMGQRAGKYNLFTLIPESIEEKDV